MLLPGDEEPTTLMTEVRWVRPRTDDGGTDPGLGLRFVEVTAEVLAKIQRFAEKRDPLYYEDD
jgi:hypothetical protein